MCPLIEIYHDSPTEQLCFKLATQYYKGLWQVANNHTSALQINGCEMAKM